MAAEIPNIRSMCTTAINAVYETYQYSKFDMSCHEQIRIITCSFVGIRFCVYVSEA